MAPASCVSTNCTSRHRRRSGPTRTGRCAAHARRAAARRRRRPGSARPAGAGRPAGAAAPERTARHRRPPRRRAGTRRRTAAPGSPRAPKARAPGARRRRTAPMLASRLQNRACVRSSSAGEAESCSGRSSAMPNGPSLDEAAPAASPTWRWTAAAASRPRARSRRPGPASAPTRVPPFQYMPPDQRRRELRDRGEADQPDR